MNQVSVRSRRQSGVGGVRGAIGVALLLSAGVIGWWSFVPPAVLADGGQPGSWHLLVTVLLVVPVALLAAGGGGWIASRYGRQAAGPRRLLVRAGATAGLFALLLLMTVPAQRAAYDLVPTAPSAPNLAAIQYDASCQPISSPTDCARMEEELSLDTASLEKAHQSLVHHTGHSNAAQEAMTAGFTAGDRAVTGADATAYAVQDTAIVLLLALPLALLGLYLAARLSTAARAAGQRRFGRGGFGRGGSGLGRSGLSRIRLRWIAAASGMMLVIAGDLALGQAATAQVTPFSMPLRIPPVLTGSHINLEMKETDVQIMPSGPPTRMWTYNGIFPAPTIRRPSGQTTRVTFRNNLPVTFGEATVHHHGSHSRPSEDGQPDSELIPPGGRRTYVYENREGGEAERAVTQWYHDHRMDVTGRNVWNGLVGMSILDDEVERALPLPKGEFDVPLIVADRTFDANNQIPYTFSIVGTLGDTHLINGVPQPYYNVGDRKYRFRVLNASNRRPFIMSLSNGQTMTQISTDSGLMPAPIERTQILLQPAERVEVVIDFAGHLGENITLMNNNTTGSPGNPAPEMMQFRVNRDLVDNSSVPATLRAAPTFPEPSESREFVLRAQTDAAGNLNRWTINDQSFDSTRFDADPILGSTERWTFFNNSPQPHAVHLHDVDWRLESRFQLAFDESGKPIPGSSLPIDPAENALKETFSVLPGQGFSVLTTFTDHVGPYVFHCHMLEHEDMAMMAQFNVRPATG